MGHVAIAKQLPQVCLKILEREDFVYVNAKDQAQRTSLHLAAIYDLGEVAEAILEHGGFAEVNARDDSTGQTALLWAARSGSVRVAEALLMSPDVDLTVCNSAGIDAFTLANSLGHDEVANIIQKHLEWKGYK